MRKISKNWIETSLGAVADINMGQSPKGQYTNTNNVGIPLIGGASDYEENKINASRYTSKPTKLCAAGDIVISIRATIGKLAVADQVYCLGRGVAGLTSYMEPRLLYYILTADRQKLEDAGVGSTFRQIDKKTLDNWPILLPPELEQKELVLKLDSLLAKTKKARENLKIALGLSEVYRQSILEYAFNGELTKDWRKSHKVKAAKFFKLRDLAVKFEYGTSSKSSAKGQVPVLRMGNIQEGKLNWEKLVYTSDANEISKYSLTAGDVLFNRTNSPDLVGKTAVYNGEREAIFAGYLIRIRCSDRLLPSYLSYCLNSPQGKAYCRSVKNDGVSQSNINAQKLASFYFPVPSIDEQKEIVRQIDRAFNWISGLNDTLNNTGRLLSHLDKSVLTKGVEGNLISNFPNSSSAGDLLKRIALKRELKKSIPKVMDDQLENRPSMSKTPTEVLSETNEWLSSQDLFLKCGVTENATTEEIEPIYAELRTLDQEGRLLVEPVLDAEGRKLFDQIKLTLHAIR